MVARFSLRFLVAITLMTCLAVSVALLGLDRSSEARAGAVRQATDCASIGQAANFAVFSSLDFNASNTAGTSITGRIAAGRDVTVDGVSISPRTGDATPEVVAGGDVYAGVTTGSGGTLNGGLSYAGTLTRASNFTINGTVSHAPPPFSFTDAFADLRDLSSSLDSLDQSTGATVDLNRYSNALTLTGIDDGLNVFTVSAAQLTQASGIVINLTQADATALINVTTDTDLATAPQYMNLQGSAAPSGIVWNFPLATSFTYSVNRGIDWQGTILAPNATIYGYQQPQLDGTMIARSVEGGDWVIRHVAPSVCLPKPTPDTTLTLTALCRNASGALTMRLRNTGDADRSISWQDLNGTDSGALHVSAHSDAFFDVTDPADSTVIEATSGNTTVRADGTNQRCEGRITVELVTVGPAPTGQTWEAKLESGYDFSRTFALGDGDQRTFTVAGAYLDGQTGIDEVIGGAAYIVDVPDTHGGVVTTNINPIEILDGQDEIVVITVTYTEQPPGETTPPGETPPPTPEIPPPPESTGPDTPPSVSEDEPTLPPGAPQPAEGPELAEGVSGTDLSIAHRITPRRLPVGGTIKTTTVIRNDGDKPANAVLVRELPQYKPSNPNSVARVLAISTTKGICTSKRPVICQLGTLKPGEQDTIRTSTTILVLASLDSVVVVSSDTAETNTANNTAIAAVTTTQAKTKTQPRPIVKIGITGPPQLTGPPHVGQPTAYTIKATGTGTHVRVCATPPHALSTIKAPGTFRYHGRYCIDIPRMTAGRVYAFALTGIPSVPGKMTLSVDATGENVLTVRRSRTDSVLAAFRACTAATARPIAHPAC
ncbi:MAG TPA: collagen-binding domain-containing protein [Solirubrobacteraceae bacterium]|jgi:choice-of-anchor A domain-containing protein|nr:collagen-binding domain-containing protein [Solirubrobacteraceae bacterium]